MIYRKLINTTININKEKLIMTKSNTNFISQKDFRKLARMYYNNSQHEDGETSLTLLLIDEMTISQSKGELDIRKYASLLLECYHQIVILKATNYQKYEQAQLLYLVNSYIELLIRKIKGNSSVQNIHEYSKLLKGIIRSERDNCSVEEHIFYIEECARKMFRTKSEKIMYSMYGGRI